MGSPRMILEWGDHPPGGAEIIAREVCGSFRIRFLSNDRNLFLSSYEMGRCRLNRVVGGPIAVTNCASTWHDPNEVIRVMLLVEPARFRQGNVTTLLEPGSIMFDVLSGGQVISSPVSTNQIVVHIPRAILMPRFSGLLRRSVVFRASEPGLSRILSALLISVFDELDSLDATEMACIGASIVQMITDLLAIRENEAERGVGLDTLLARTKAYVISNAGDPLLRISTIARQMGCSERYLYKAFEGEPLTLERFILNTRLDRARAHLLATDHRISISSIAEAAGFSAYAHFSRAFKTRFGVSPSDCASSVH